MLSVHHHPADPAASIEAAVYYDVKYVLNGNSDVSVHCSFVRPVQELSRGSRKRGLEPGPTPALILAPVLCMQPKGRRKIAGSKALIMSSNESPGQKSAESEEINGDSATSGSGSRSRCKGSHVRGPHAADISEHKAVSKRDRIQRGSSALREERDGTDSVSVSVSVLGTSSLPSRSVCISHTSLENADILKLEKFIQKFSSQLHDNSCPSSSTSSSSASSSSTPRPVTLLSPRVPSRQTPQSSCTLTDNFDGSITHLIVSVDKKGLLRKRTLKFMQAIMGMYCLVLTLYSISSIDVSDAMPCHADVCLHSSRLHLSTLQVH